jgi:hypothetical protein
MTATTLDYPLTSLPGLPVQEGQRFEGYVRGGMLHVTIPATTSGSTSSDEKRLAAERFVTKWAGKGKLLAQDDLEADPKLAYLTAKHLR